jgi:hypothetical protein
MTIPGLATISKWLAVAGSLAAAIFYGLMKKAQAETADTRAEFAQDNAKAAEMQRDQLEESAEAARVAVVNGQEETKDAVEKAKQGDFEGLN